MPKSTSLSSKAYSITLGTKLLIVEDESITALSIKEMLKAKGYEVMGTCFTAEEAIDFVSKKKPDLVLMDISLAGPMKGHEAALLMHEVYDLPVIFLTSYSQESIIQSAIESGSFCYLLKPFQENLLVVNIELTLARHKSNLAVKELVKTRDRFFSIIAHDLRNPLDALNKIAKLLAEQYEKVSSEDMKSYLLEMSKTSKDLYDLTDNLLEWTRIQTESLTAKPIDLNLRQLTDYSIQLLKSQWTLKEIIVSNNIPESYRVFVDQYMMGSVLSNILTNAIKFSYPKGSIVIEASLDKDFIQVEITDHGIGIDSKYTKDLFDGNYKKVGTVHEKGTGLGLVICKQFVQLHGGDIFIVSELGKGSTVKFRIPNSVKGQKENK